MRLNQHQVVIGLLILLLTTPLSLLAQAEDITVVGSGIVAPLFDALVTGAETDLAYDSQITGTDGGFEAFCNGEATIINANRPMTVAEESNCDANDINFSEIVLGYDAIVFVTNPELDFLSCATINELGIALAPSSITNSTWGDTLSSADEAESEVRVFLPTPDSIAYFLADSILPGVGFRADAETVTEAAERIEQIANTPGGIGFIEFGSLDIAEDVQVVDLRNNDIRRCITPTAEAVGDGAYTASTPLLSYVNTDALQENDELANVYSFIASETSSETIADSGFAPPTDFDYTTNQDIVAGETSGRQFSRSLTDFQIPPTIAGTINIGGAAAAYPLLNGVATSFTQQYQNATINVNTLGEPTGVRQLCNGELAMAATYAPPSDETVENCEAADINLIDLEVGRQATVLVANNEADYLECLTTEDLVTTWQASATDVVTNWNDVNEDYPEDSFILFAGQPSNPAAGLMMQQAAGRSVPLRIDVETNTDPLYRAAATANVEAALTYMSWGQYQDVLANDQTGIQLVSMDSGDGCIEPTEETIMSGEYPLSRTLHLLINESDLQRQEVQSYLWYLFQEQRFPQFQQNNFDLITLKALFDTRATLQDIFNQAIASAAAEEDETPTDASDEATTEQTEDTDPEETESDNE